MDPSDALNIYPEHNNWKKENVLKIPVCPYCSNNANNNVSIIVVQITKRLVISITSSNQFFFFFFFWKWIFEVFNTCISKNLIQIKKIIIKFLSSSTLEPCIMDGCALCLVPKLNQVIKSTSFHYLSQPPTDFIITHQFYIWQYL